MKNLFIAFIFFSLFSNQLNAQMVVNQDTLYGNEWIDYDKDYYKLQVSVDGIYRISYETLLEAGVPVGSLDGSNFQLFNLGKEIAISTSTDGAFASGDFIEFYGKKNKSELDQYLFSNPETELLNPEYSMYTNNNAYFLTWDISNENKRFKDIENDLVDVPEKEAFYMEERVDINSGFHIKNFGLQAGVFYSNYTGPEGFGQNMRANFNENFGINKIYREGSIPASLQITLGFNNATTYLNKISVMDSLLLESEFINNNVRTIEVAVPNDLLAATTKVNIKNEGSKHSVSVVKLVYPRTFDANNNSFRKFKLPFSDTRRYFEVARFKGQVGSNYILDLVNEERMLITFDNNLAMVNINPSEKDRELFLYNDLEGIIEIEELSEVKFKEQNELLDKDYLIFSNAYLYIDSLNGNQNWVEEYANYRKSEAGGNYKTAVINIEEIVDQFAYGISLHPMSIRNFNHYLLLNGLKAKVALIIGKGRDYSDIRGGTENSFPNLVPTWGFNGADNLLFATNATNAPSVAVGRIPAVEPFEIKSYLDKVIEYETPPDYSNQDERLWKKKVIHLNGGANESEIATIRSYMDLMAFNISNNQYSGQVTSFYKTRENANDESEAAKLTKLINDGVGIVTFFGHSAATSFDYSINNPEGFTNKGRYFIMNAMGCNSGQIHSRVRSLSERFILAPEKGAIAFMASSGLGYISAYRTFGLDHYNKLGNENYGGTLGDILQSNLKVLDRSFETHKLLAQQMTLNGDPAIKLNYLPGPDYVVAENSVKVNSGALNAGMQDFEIEFDMLNLGGGLLDSIYVRVEQELPTGERIIVSESKERTPKFYENVNPTIVGQGLASAGWNRFHITLDVLNNVEEVPNPIGEENNTYIHSDDKEGFPVYINPIGVKLEYPNNFGIIGTNTVEFQATASPSVTDQDQFFIELDTSELFNSPIKISETINPNGTDLNWEPSFSFEEGDVYYWRVSPDTTGRNGFVWENHSFIYLDGIVDGWNQSHYYQYLKDEYHNLDLNEDRSFKFKKNVIDLKLFNKLAGGSSLPTFYINNSYLDVYRSFTISEGIAVMVVDPNTGIPWFNPAGGLYESETSDNARIYYFAYSSNDPAQRSNLINLLEDVIPDNFYVGIMTFDKTNGTLGAESWAADSIDIGKNIFSVLEKQGAEQIRNLENGDKTYIMVYQKGQGAIREVIGEAENTNIEVEEPIENKWFEGTIKSTVIGPSNSWNKLEWKANSIESDSISINIYAVRPNGTELLLEQRIKEENFSLESIDASQYPFIRLEILKEDLEERTSPQLDYWRVFFEPVSFVSVKDEINELGSLNVFPNPFDAGITLDMTLLESMPLKVEIFNSVGVRVESMSEKNYQKGNHQFNLNTKQYTSGTYFIRISSKSGIKTQKLIKI